MGTDAVHGVAYGLQSESGEESGLKRGRDGDGGANGDEGPACFSSIVFPRARSRRLSRNVEPPGLISCLH